MAAKSRDSESSLELLLDTMCNTFGGVMFIAIALVVLMSMMTRIEAKITVKTEDLRKLEQELTLLMEQNKTLQKEVSKLEKHPGKKQISEILQLEKQLSALQLKLELKQTENKLKNRELQLLRKHTDIQKKKNEETKSKLADLETEEGKLQQDLARMRRSAASASSHAMTFRIMEQRREEPYFLIVSGNCIWRVGPNRDPQTRRLTPSGDCTSIKRPANIVTCRPVPGKGIPILFQGRVSQGVIDLLRSIPSDRIPHFSIDKDSMKTFCILREYLKQQKAIHGVDTAFEYSKSFTYVISTQHSPYYY